MAADQAIATERVLFVPAAHRGALESLHHTALGSVSEGVWIAAGDAAFFSLIERAAPSLLYFTRDGYQRAVRQLKPREVDEVIRKRRDDWAPNAIHHGVYHVFETLRCCVSLLGAALNGSVDDVHRQVAALAGDMLVLLARLSGEGRYDDVKIEDMLVFTLEGEARLLAEHEAAREQAERRKDANETSRIGRFMQAQKESAAVVQVALAERGRPEFGTWLPFVDVLRVLLVTPRDQQVIKQLIKDQVFVDWRGGIVVPWRIRLLDELRAPGRTLATLYLDRGAYFGDLDELSRAQLEREWAERLDGGRVETPAAMRDHLNGLLLEQHLLRRNLLDGARRHDAGLTPAIAGEVGRETNALLEALALQPTWLPRRPQSATEAVTMLRQAVQVANADATAFAEWSRYVRQTALQKRFLEIAAASAAIRARADQLPSSNP